MPAACALRASPAEACDQYAHHEGAHQAADGEHGHGEGVHEGEGLLVQGRPVASDPGLVVEGLDVLRHRERQTGSVTDLSRAEGSDRCVGPTSGRESGFLIF